MGIKLFFNLKYDSVTNKQLFSSNTNALEPEILGNLINFN